MFRDYRFERTFFPQSSRVFRSNGIEVLFRVALDDTLRLDRLPQARDFSIQPTNPLRDGLELQRSLPSLPAKCFRLR